MFRLIKKKIIGLLRACTIGNSGEFWAFNSEENCKTFHYPFSVSANKYSGSCNTIVDQYARVCVPHKVNNINVEVFNLISGINETRILVQH